MLRLRSVRLRPIARLRRYTKSMTMTTIKVSAETRDRLKTHAIAAHVSLGEYLARLADGADRRAHLAAMATAMRGATAEELHAYRREAAEWADADLLTP